MLQSLRIQALLPFLCSRPQQEMTIFFFSQHQHPSQWLTQLVLPQPVHTQQPRTTLPVKHLLYSHLPDQQLQPTRSTADGRREEKGDGNRG